MSSPALLFIVQSSAVRTDAPSRHPRRNSEDPMLYQSISERVSNPTHGTVIGSFPGGLFSPQLSTFSQESYSDQYRIERAVEMVGGMMAFDIGGSYSTSADNSSDLGNYGLGNYDRVVFSPADVDRVRERHEMASRGMSDRLFERMIHQMTEFDMLESTWLGLHHRVELLDGEEMISRWSCTVRPFLNHRGQRLIESNLLIVEKTGIDFFK